MKEEFTHLEACNLLGLNPYDLQEWIERGLLLRGNPHKLWRVAGAWATLRLKGKIQIAEFERDCCNYIAAAVEKWLAGKLPLQTCRLVIYDWKLRLVDDSQLAKVNYNARILLSFEDFTERVEMFETQIVTER